MKKLTKQTRNTLLNAALILGTFALVLFLTVRSGEIITAWKAMLTVDPIWATAAVGCFCAFTFGEGFSLYIFFRQQSVKVKLGTAILAGLIGMFYSAITPSATGGQPMQVFALKKRDVSPGLSSSALAVKFFNFQSALLILGAAMWIMHPAIVEINVNQIRWIVLVGFFLNGLTVVGVLLLAINKNIVRAIIVFLARLAYKLHIVKDLERTSSHADAALNDFHASVDMLKQHPFRMLVLLMFSFIHVTAYVSVIYCLYRAFGLNSNTYGELATLQLLLFIGASMAPLPGASGAQEGGFYLFFRQVFPSGTLVGALLLWRFVTYYLSIIIGFIGVTIESARSMRRIKISVMKTTDTDEK
jgi:glycosyltransferase 2 family protein